MPPQRSSASERRPLPASGLQSILIVDDSDGDALLAEMVLTECVPDATIRHIDSGQEALDALEDETFDLILLDLAMPGLTGFDVLSELKNRPDFATDIVVLTSSTRPEDRRTILDQGIGFVVKDSDFGSFRFHLAAALPIVS